MDDLKTAIADVVKVAFDVPVEPELTRPDEKFGDYASNVALQLAKQLDKKPRDVANQLADALRQKMSDQMSEITVAEPGFINLRLRDKALWGSVSTELATQPYADKTVVIETNNPNAFKDMHIGHAYNSIIADTIANLLEAGGCNLHRVSYHGDVGLHVGKSMWATFRFIGGEPRKLEEIAESERPAFMSRMYQEGTKAYDEDEEAKQAIGEYTKESFTLTDPVFKEVYETCKGWSFAYFDQVLTRLGSKPIERRYFEREADEIGRKTVEDHIGKVFERSDGAVIFPGEKYGLHTRVFISSQGNTLYEARDLGLIQLKAHEFKPDVSYIVTAVEQKEYFKVVFKAAELALPDLAGVTHNIPTGTVKLSSGKMSSRKGTFINIGWLIDEISKALLAKGGEGAATQDAIIGALRYTLLKVRTGGDVIFDISEAISLEGNSGPYLQYAHARARSILKKHKAENPKSEEETLEPEERSLLRKVSEYPEIVEDSVKGLLPSHITTYLYELAQVFNRFYEHNRVIDDPRQDIRLQLVKSYADTLKNGLELLNIPAPERM